MKKAEQEKKVKQPKPKCIKCDITLVAIGDKRKNGAHQKDFDGRIHHYKCWLKILNERKAIQDSKAMMARYSED